jgi:dipeptidyl aminopeptidase/acylaminoacyl peptidase
MESLSMTDRKSYRGFAALSCLTRLPRVWRCSVAMCANGDLVARGPTGPPYWRGRLRAWVGDPEDPFDRRRLIERNPIHHDQLLAPTLIIHGVLSPAEATGGERRPVFARRADPREAS